MRPRSRTAGLAAAALVLFITGCAKNKFQPAAERYAVPEQPNLGRASDAGVTMFAQINEWKGEPSDLRDYVTPVKVKIDNESEHALSIRYDDFVLSNPRGIVSHAIPPSQIDGYREQLVPVTPAYYPGPGYPYWGWGPYWYGTGWVYAQEPFPTADMIRKAIPEAVLNAGGSVQGYLYFRLLPKDTQAVTLTADLKDAGTQKTWARISVPFVHQK
jgi:hypothetical protein